MKYIITESKLQSTFNSIMKEFSELERAEKSYDWYDHDKSRYVDLDTINFYEDVEYDWEDDSWVLQYQENPGDIGTVDEVPLLRYSVSWPFKSVINMFGDHFESLLKNWFEEIYNLPVKTVTIEQ